MKVLTKYKGVCVSVCVCMRVSIYVCSAMPCFPPTRLNAPSSPTENGGVLKSSIGKIGVSSPADLINGKICSFFSSLGQQKPCVHVCVYLYRSR